MSHYGDKKNGKFDCISYCGLFCPDCPLYAGKVSDLARDLRKELRRVQYDKFAQYISKFQAGKELKKFNECYVVLGTLIKFRCESGCRLGGGSDTCEIRECNQSQSFEGCWNCPNYSNCTKLDSLNPLHGDAHRKNLETLHKRGISEFSRENNRW